MSVSYRLYAEPVWFGVLKFITRSSSLEAHIFTEILVLTFLILLNGVLAGSEIALVSIRSTRLQELVSNNVRWAISAKKLRDNPERFLATVQVGITVIGTTAGAFGGSTLSVHLIPVFQRIPWLVPYAEEIAVGLVVALVSYLAIVIGELVPKSLAMRSPERYGRMVASPVLWLSSISRPAVYLLAGSSNVVLKLFGDRTSFTEARLSSEEVRTIVEDAAKTGSIHPQSSSIASRAIDFGHLRVLDVMVPRHAVVVVSAQATLDDVTSLLKANPFSRLPIYGSSKDEILGYLAAKDVVIKGKSLCGSQAVARDILRPAIFVPESQSAIQLLQRLQKEHQQIAFVVDEQGSFAGLVTMEDLLEELVGEIFSEFREERVTQLAWDEHNCALVPGSLPLRELNRQLELDLNEGAYWTTLGGLCLNLLGHIPVQGEKLALGEGLEAEIVEVHGTRLHLIRLKRDRALD